MNFEEYERHYAAIYADFAKTLQRIIGQAIAAQGLAVPQSIQGRAKSPGSLRARLEGAGLLDSDAIETVRKDLAGIRLIFYTNTDVDAFIHSRVIDENFEVDREAIKIHHPSVETKGNRYQGIHYIVRLKDDRARLPEYARFAGLRCEIQIQTILNHAWSETSHDIIYKNQVGGGYGGKAMERIEQRFNEIMDNYLLPAGYEFQRIQHDYNRLLQGKALFDRDAIQSLLAAQDNNERHELLVTLRDYTIPHYDDLAGVYDDLRGPLVEVAKAARNTPALAFDTTFGQLGGYSAEDVVGVVVDIFDRLRYVDAIGSFEALCEIYRDEESPNIRKRITESVRHLAEYNLNAWEQVGPAIQLALADRIGEIPSEDRKGLGPLLLTAWQEILSPEISGTTWHADSVTLSQGPLPVSDDIKGLRDTAVTALLQMLDDAGTEGEQREVLAALDAAIRLGSGATPNALLAVILADTKRIVEAITQRAADLRYEILEHLENKLLWEYRRAKDIVAADGTQFPFRAEASAVVQAIEAFRDVINRDGDFVKYKTLIGFEGVFPQHWEDEDFDFQGSEEYRQAQIDHFIADISAANQAEWFRLIARCAATKSDDAATFPAFGNFLAKLAAAKPGVAASLLETGGPDVKAFSPGILNGLLQSGESAIYTAALARLSEDDGQLLALVRHLRGSKVDNPSLAVRLLERAMTQDDRAAVIECLLLAMEVSTDIAPPKETFFRPAVAYLTDRHETRWVFSAWYQGNMQQFLQSLPVEDAALLLDNLLAVPNINSQAERVLAQIAIGNREAVWDFFGKRLEVEQCQERENPNDDRYQAVPFRLYTLHKELSRDASLALAKTRSWYGDNKELFRFRGARLLNSVFPDLMEDFAQGLIDLVNYGGSEDADFVLEIMQNYHGELTTHEVLKAVIAKYPDDRRKMTAVMRSFDSTGVVSGVDGLANAMRGKKTLLDAWLTDDRPEVRAFAEKHARELEVNIVAEQRRADERRELRRRQFNGD